MPSSESGYCNIVPVTLRIMIVIKSPIPLVLPTAAGQRGSGMHPFFTSWNDYPITVAAQPYKAGQRPRPIGRGQGNAQAVTTHRPIQQLTLKIETQTLGRGGLTLKGMLWVVRETYGSLQWQRRRASPEQG
jgi:hypothetical protein